MTTATRKLTTFSRSLAMAAAACAAMAVTATSFAAPLSDAAPSVAVRYDDLNLATPDGVKTLYSRIRNAASQVCPTAYSRDLKVFAASQQCRAEAVARAVDKVNSQQLAVLHAARSSHG